MDLVVVRHAAIAYLDTDGRRLDAVALNPPLTGLGEEQAEALAARLARAGITHLYSSPAIRCLQTAQAVCAAAGLGGTVVPWLGEQGCLWEDWERRPVEQIPLDFPALTPGAPPAEADWSVAADECAESPQRRKSALSGRARKVLDLVFAAHPPTAPDRVCLCTHGGLGGYGLLPVLLGTADTDNGRFVLDHASLTEVRCDERGHLVRRINCTRHLVGLTAVICSRPGCGHRGAHREERTCPRCGAPMLSSCPTCATDIPAAAGPTCPHCANAYHH